MFLIPKNNLKNFDPERCCFVLNEFAAAEFASGLEMLYAAKNINNKKLSEGFIRHALDEYKHSFIFNNLKNQIVSEYKINKKELNFVPNHLYNKGYIFKDHFIFEKKKINNFAIFIGANEEIAEKKLVAFANQLRNQKKTIFNEIQSILKDEEKHAEYSLRFAKKNNGLLSYKIKITKERIISYLRHFYANSLNKISFIFYPILIIILIIVALLSCFLKLKKKTSIDDIMNSIEPNSMV
tara:strand:+ start:149 stop:865 length:717 start_codon:yes stop_codon:yes gene_type:complete